MARGNPTPPSRQGPRPRRAKRPGARAEALRADDGHASTPVRGDRADGGSGPWTRPRAAVDKRSRSALPSARGQHVTHRGFPGLRGPGFVGSSRSRCLWGGANSVSRASRPGLRWKDVGHDPDLTAPGRVSRASRPGLRWKGQMTRPPAEYRPSFPGFAARASLEFARRKFARVARSFPGLRGPGFVGIPDQGQGPGPAKATFPGLRGPGFVGRESTTTSSGATSATFPGLRSPGFVGRREQSRFVRKGSRFPGLRWKTTTPPTPSPRPAVSRASRPGLRWKGAPTGMVRRMRVVSRASRPGLRWKTVAIPAELVDAVVSRASPAGLR